MSDMRRMRLAGLLVGAAVAATAGLAGCASSASSAAQSPTSALVAPPPTAAPNVVLTPLGAQRIGLETAPVSAGPGGAATFPYAALLYEPNGQTVVYVPTGTLTYTRHFVKVDAITGGQVTVTSGVTPGERVVTDGAEELLGVQNGVGEET
jgi:multidrug efflux pump subunit AcrA (membrane-fusion protein)